MSKKLGYIIHEPIQHMTAWGSTLGLEGLWSLGWLVGSQSTWAQGLGVTIYLGPGFGGVTLPGPRVRGCLSTWAQGLGVTIYLGPGFGGRAFHCSDMPALVSADRVPQGWWRTGSPRAGWWGRTREDLIFEASRAVFGEAGLGHGWVPVPNPAVS